MRVYMLRRLLLAIPTVFLVSLIVFFMIRFIPGSAIDAAVVRMGMVGGEIGAVTPGENCGRCW